ncbi:BPL-N domain-containing protein [Rhodococcus sp. X156]|uniref:BPL-N domain-containing protein n=1 Tax=Rhodococcus sp. X156 TaxID=2499145 RepID=UPI0019D28C92|nr:BPL-N domain-containing protein [Rhodococcus sp. X156]
MSEARVTRRQLLLGLGGAGVLAAAGGVGVLSIDRDSGPLALVYRGPAATPGCPEAVTALLRSAHFRTSYVGPDEDLSLSADTLATATAYAQPGGANLDPAWDEISADTEVIRAWVRQGGSYLGFCLGGYLAGATPGFRLLPGDTEQYVTLDGATVRTTRDTIVSVLWRGVPRRMYFQDGPVFRIAPGADAEVIATYLTGEPAAVVSSYGSGRVGVVGPHPEADQSWFDSAGLNSAGVLSHDLGIDLVKATTWRPSAQGPGPVGPTSTRYGG